MSTNPSAPRPDLEGIEERIGKTVWVEFEQTEWLIDSTETLIAYVRELEEQAARYQRTILSLERELEPYRRGQDEGGY